MIDKQNNTISLTSNSVDQTIAIGSALAAILRAGDILALYGELGSGKTQFVRGMAIGLGADPRLIASPTFILMTEYAASPPIIHIDAYRMHGISDLQSTGWSDSIANESVTLIEWADRIDNYLPKDRLKITFNHTADQSHRQLVIEPQNDWLPRITDIRNALATFNTTANNARQPDIETNGNTS